MFDHESALKSFNTLFTFQIQKIVYQKNMNLTPKEPRPFFCQKTRKTTISVAKSRKKFKLFFFTSNLKILHPTSIKKCGKNFKISDYIDCKIFEFKVEKTSFSARALHN